MHTITKISVCNSLESAIIFQLQNMATWYVNSRILVHGLACHKQTREENNIHCTVHITTFPQKIKIRFLLFYFKLY